MRLRQARALLGGGTADAPAPGDGAATGAGSGRAPTRAESPAAGPPLAALLRGVAPRLLARPTWAPADDAVVRRYFAVDPTAEER